ncbi:hypothetical protein AB0H76_33405 [Nocardia sp. NPDC050712]|uniref:hypothetical protein n=1 Tax=Nocardia sp. NPDC050712 TaxID=3155518 RepID=UPI0033F97D8B
MTSPIPDDPVVTIADSDLSTCDPPKPKEYRADLSFLLASQDSRLVAIIEPQTAAPKPHKRRSWPAYVVNAHRTHHCDAHLLVIARRQQVARSCAKPIRLGHRGFTLAPHVIGPDNTPDPTDPALTAANPELAVLACLTGALDLDIVANQHLILGLIANLDEDRKRRYNSAIRDASSPQIRHSMEALMTTVYRDKFYEKIKAEGRAEGAAELLLDILREREFPVSSELRERAIHADEEQLHAWALRAIKATSIEEVFLD